MSNPTIEQPFPINTRLHTRVDTFLLVRCNSTSTSIQRLVVISAIISKHTTSHVNLDFLFLNLFFFLLFGSISTIAAATAAASSATSATGSRNELSDRLGIAQVVGKDDGVKGLNFRVASSL